MLKQIIIVGCGGFGREVHDIIDAINEIEPTWEVLGFADDSPSPENVHLVAARGSQILGAISEIAGQAPANFVIGIGNGHVRHSVDSILSGVGWTAATLVHPSATLGFDVQLSPGTVICSGVRLTTNIRVGRHTHVNINSTVGHDATLDDYVTVNPLVAISGWVSIGEQAMIGTHAAILQNLTVGARSIVGAASLVTKDVPVDVTVKGVPAR